MALERREEAVGLALRCRQIALCVFVAAARLKQGLDRGGFGQNRYRRPRFSAKVLRQALLLDPRPFRFLARGPQLVERRLQALHHAGSEIGQVAEGGQRLLGFPVCVTRSGAMRLSRFRRDCSMSAVSRRSARIWSNCG